MKVLHVIPSLATVDGGPAEVVRRLATALQQHEVEIFVLTTDLRSGNGPVAIPGIKVEVVRSRWPARFNFAPGAVFALRRLVGHADVVHIHAVDNFMSSVAALVANRRGRPVVVEPHGAYDFYHRNQNRAVKWAYWHLVDRVVFRKVALWIGSSSREVAGIEQLVARPVRRMALGVDPSLLASTYTRLEPTTRNLLFLGRITEKKGVDLLLRAFAAAGLKSQGVRLVIAGPTDPRLPFCLRSLIDELDLVEFVDLLGVVGPAERAKLLRSSSLFALPSADESFGVSVAEAMATGCPVICTPQVGVGEDVGAAGGVMLVDRDVEAWSEALRQAFDAPIELTIAGAKARSYAAQYFSWDAVAAGLANDYRKLGDSSI